MTVANSRARKDIELDDLSDDVRRRPSLLPILPTLPTDRPFANLAQGSSVLPQAYATIFQATIDPMEKAKRLRLALRRDNLNLLAYCLMLACMGSLAFFQLGKGMPALLNETQQKILSLTILPYKQVRILSTPNSSSSLRTFGRCGLTSCQPRFWP